MTDSRVIFLVTMFLGLIVLGGMGAVVALTLSDREIPEMIGLVTTGALGSLASLLVSTRVDPAQLPTAKPSVADSPPSPDPSTGATLVPKPSRVRKAT